MKSSDLPDDVRRALLGAIRDQVGSVNYHDLVTRVGEDGLLKVVLQQAGHESGVLHRPRQWYEKLGRGRAHCRSHDDVCHPLPASGRRLVVVAVCGGVHLVAGHDRAPRPAHPACDRGGRVSRRAHLCRSSQLRRGCTPLGPQGPGRCGSPLHRGRARLVRRAVGVPGCPAVVDVAARASLLNRGLAGLGEGPSAWRHGEGVRPSLLHRVRQWRVRRGRDF